LADGKAALGIDLVGGVVAGDGFRSFRSFRSFRGSRAGRHAHAQSQRRLADAFLQFDGNAADQPQYRGPPECGR
jgi:hypothetical protein